MNPKKLFLLPCTLTFVLFLSSETPYCASVHRTLLYRAMFDCLNSPSISWRGCWLGPLYDCVCLFVSYICICLLYLFFVFVSVSVFVRPLSSSLSSFMLIIIIYLCNRNLSSPSSAPYTRILLLQNFNKLSATLNVKLTLPSYWLSFCQSSNQQAVTLVCSIYFSRNVPRESNAHGYLYFPFQSLYKCSKHETRNWINMRIIYYSIFFNLPLWDSAK